MSATIHRPQEFDVRNTRAHDKGYSSGNEPPSMPPADYVTHGEFDAAMKRIDTRFDATVSRSEFQESRAEINERFARIETRLDQTASKVDVHEVRVEMHAMKAELIKWIVGTAIGLGAAAITVMTFVLNNAAPKAPTSQPAPIIIQVPGTPPPPPPPIKK